MNQKRVLSLILVGLFLVLIAVQTISVVSAADSIWDKITQGMTDPSSWNISVLTEGTGFAKFLIFLLITLFVFAVSESVPFLEGRPGIGFLISVVVGILSSFYIKTEEVYTILLSYSVFGIVLTTVFPFLLIAVISKKLHEKGHIMFGKILWVALAVVLVVKWFTAREIGTFGKLAYPITLVIVVVMLLWENRLYLLAFKREIREFKNTAKMQNLADMQADLESFQRRIRDSNDVAVQNVLIQQHNALAAKYRKAGGAWNAWGG